MTAHRARCIVLSKRLSNCQINAIGGGRRFKRTTDEKHSGRKWRPQGQLYNAVGENRRGENLFRPEQLLFPGGDDEMTRSRIRIASSYLTRDTAPR